MEHVREIGPVWVSLAPEKEAVEGPLQGVRFAVKDNIDVAGMVTTAGCPAFGYVAEKTASAVQKLLDAGAILAGKTNMDQFATGLVGARTPYGACSSVFNSEYISGGSSSGSAVAVASGQVRFALGTDTAGSGRVPAAFNGIFGLKPTRGLVSTHGVVPACRSLDCVSVFAQTAEEARMVLEVAADSLGRRQGIFSSPVRFGVPQAEQREFFGDREYKQLYGEAIEQARAAGCEIVEIDLQPFLNVAKLLYEGPYVAERYAAVGEFVEAHADEVNAVVRDIILNARSHSASDAFKAVYRLEELRRQTQEAWRRVDALLLPTTPTIYKIQEVLQDPVRLNARLGYYTNFVNLLDLCALAVPAGFTGRGLPFGVSLIAPAFHENALLEASDVFTEAQTPRKLPVGWVPLTVLGAHLRGQPLNWQLTDRGARFLRQTRTARDYKLYALPSTPPKPGLVRALGFAGPGIEAEVWLVPEEQFGGFVRAIPPPLGIGTCELEDGTTTMGFLCEGWGVQGSPEITEFGGWLAYLSR